MAVAQSKGRWKPGTQILLQDMWRDLLVTSRPVIVVEDAPEYLATYSHPGARIGSRAIKDRYSMSVEARVDAYTDATNAGYGELEERVAGDSHVLRLTPPDSWHSVWLFWAPDWQLKFWYVNLEMQARRTRGGVSTHDCALDIVEQPDMSWSFKDKDEFEELVRRGFFTATGTATIRTEADRMIEIIEQKRSPFSDGWESWRSDPSWPVPELPEDWRLVDR